MTKVILPKVKLKQRSINNVNEKKALVSGLHPIVARVLAARPTPYELIDSILSPKLSYLENPIVMQDISLASKRIALAIVNGEYIGLETDHDCDGQTSHAVFFEALTTYFNVPQEKILSYIGNRLTEGYGLSASVANRILESKPRPSLVITADNGSSDEPRIKLLKDAGIDIIVTDHHEIPSDGIPKSAYAVLNPTRNDCAYQDTYIAGCMVAWLLMTVVRKELISLNYLSSDAPSLGKLLDYVAVGTVADCVSIARSINNRIVIYFGIKLIEQLKRPCWKVLSSKFGEKVTAEDLGFGLGPLLNSDGRLDTAFSSVSFLLAKDTGEAAKWLEELTNKNKLRKEIQNKISEESFVQASKQFLENKLSLCIFLENGHSGVHGIVASRVREAFGMPVVIFSPKKISSGAVEYITGSARSTDDVHMREALAYINDNYPGLIISFGGHKGAAGVSIKKEDLKSFSKAFEKAVSLQIKKEQIGPVIFTDGQISSQDLTLEFIDNLNNMLEPFGREFEAPIFEVEADILNIKPIGDGTHAALELNIDGLYIKAVWFKIRNNPDEDFPVETKPAKLAVILKAETFRGVRELKLQIQYASNL